MILLGNKITEIVNERLSAGVHSYAFNVDNLER